MSSSGNRTSISHTEQALLTAPSLWLDYLLRSMDTSAFEKEEQLQIVPVASGLSQQAAASGQEQMLVQ